MRYGSEDEKDEEDGTDGDVEIDCWQTAQAGGIGRIRRTERHRRSACRGLKWMLAFSVER